MQHRTTRALGCAAALLSALVQPARAAEPFLPGSAGIGDAYFPLDGNGGYDVEHYLLQVRYDPSTDRLTAAATIRARATQNLARFNLDLVGLDVNAVEVSRCAAVWSREGSELIITPERGLQSGARFDVVVEYAGVPRSLSEIGPSGFIHTERGAIVAGEPHAASSWFPANDHPRDRASYTFEISVPEGMQAIANGSLEGQRTRHGWTTWRWEAAAPMATYMAGWIIDELHIDAYEQAGIRYWDGIPAGFFASIEPPTGQRFLVSQQAESSYKRLTRVITVPPEGAELSFSVQRDTEPAWDFFFVEAHTLGQDDWVTLPEGGGATSADLGFGCHGIAVEHPFLERYFGPPSDADGSCTSGALPWWAASGVSVDPRRWTIDLSAYAGRDVEVSLSYASDAFIQGRGVYVDDIAVSTGTGNTSFEDDGDDLDGWVVAGPPEGSLGNTNDWRVGTAADVPASTGASIQASLARQPEIIAFLEENFGPYPFDISGAMVTEAGIFFALELQTRPIYPTGAVDQPQSVSIMAHELAHQWFGDSLALESWQHVWLNEGFATYAQWLWNERDEGMGVQESVDRYLAIEDDDPFWTIVVADPGPEALFDSAIYNRGALALHHLRQAVGDDVFFEILQTWATAHAGTNVTTEDFIAWSEAISGQELGELFDIWIYRPEKPALTPPAPAAVRSAFARRASPSAERSLIRY